MSEKRMTNQELPLGAVRTGHKCPVSGCGKSIARWMLCCGDHWQKLPASLRNQVWNLYRNEAGSDSHQMACQAAIEELNQQ